MLELFPHWLLDATQSYKYTCQLFVAISIAKRLRRRQDNFREPGAIGRDLNCVALPLWRCGWLLLQSPERLGASRESYEFLATLWHVAKLTASPPPRYRKHVTTRRWRRVRCASLSSGQPLGRSSLRRKRLLFFREM